LTLPYRTVFHGNPGVGTELALKLQHHQKWIHYQDSQQLLAEAFSGEQLEVRESSELQLGASIKGRDWITDLYNV
jgi:hypothetical protein